MPLTRAQAVDKLETIIQELSQIMDQLKTAPDPGAGGPRDPEDICSIHNVPWRHTSYGTGHPLNDGSGKWCNKVPARPARRY